MKRLLMLLSFFPLSVMAQETVESAPAIDPVSSSYLLKLSGGLLLIIGLVFFLGWMMRRLHLVQSNNNGLIRVVSAIPLGQRERIALLQVGDEQILVGLAPGRISKLHTLSQPVEIEAADAALPGAFQEKLQRLMERGTKHA